MRPLLACSALLVLATSYGCRGTRDKSIGAGTMLTVHDEEGGVHSLRIDRIDKDPGDPDGEIFLYDTSFQDANDGTWKPFCLPDRDGRTTAIPIQGSWDGARNYVPSDRITFACTNGALAKCVRFGYKPWKSVGGVSLLEYHRACVHLVPADYCGDGRAHTRNGTGIDLFDRLHIQKREARAGLLFEAAWSPTGAVGFTITTGNPPAANSSATCSARNFERL